ncbi:MAG: 4-(cytidine 5'-diphospho)-2-C-methyl-D-erythritol kinase [Rhodobacter sp.]|nr:4-(cytidine 5'-diphospho)-2-C-methyl-D-erythritol kinase [Rhodobacter sp.]
MNFPRKTVEAFAPAKINLTLHVTGQRADGYHLLDSLVVFADVGDRVSCVPCPRTILTPVGPFLASVPCDGTNLVLRAKQAFAPDQTAEIWLEKNLPPASGIGGGSSDAAATLRALSEAFDLPLPPPQDFAGLGADVPVCLLARPTRIRGIGEQLDAVPNLPPLHMVLVNPGVEVPTPGVFVALSDKTNAPMPKDLPDFTDTAALALWLGAQRNDLELPARAIAPAIGVALSGIKQTDGCLLARMSGSGATCFGLFASRVEANKARDQLAKAHPDWWIKSASCWSL